MFEKASSDGYQSPTEGIRLKTLVHGDKTLMTEFRLSKGSVLPHHRHPHEQTGYLISGRLRLFVDGNIYVCEPGDSWCIAGDVEHGAEILEDTVAIEVFSPVREDYLPGR
jgi:quercetin dioxygenase-like cupin family protein